VLSVSVQLCQTKSKVLVQVNFSLDFVRNLSNKKKENQSNDSENNLNLETLQRAGGESRLAPGGFRNPFFRLMNEINTHTKKKQLIDVARTFVSLIINISMCL
jgi:hypothetical protein